MTIIDRDTWGARYGRGNIMPDQRPKSLIVIHHSASPDIACGVGESREMEVVRQIERHHVETNGWAGIGYSFLAFQSGGVYAGRGWGRVSAHTPGRNSTAYGICLVIDGERVAPSDAAVEAVNWLITQAIADGHIAQDFRIGAHRQFKATACPGDRVMAELARFGPLFED